MSYPTVAKRGEYELDLEKSESLDGTKQDQSSKWKEHSQQLLDSPIQKIIL